MKHARDIAFSVALLSVVLVNCSAQQSSTADHQDQGSPAVANVVGAKPEVGKIADARKGLREAEAAHPGNTVEVADALDGLVSSEIDASVVDEQTLDEVNRQVRIAAAATGVHSKTYVEALGVQVEVLIALNRAAEARPIAERLFETAQRDLPGTDEASTAAGDLDVVCATLGDFPCALRANEQALSITRKLSGNHSPDLVSPLNNLADLKFKMGDIKGSIAAAEEALTIAYRSGLQDEHIGVIENNLGANYIRLVKLDKALEHINRALVLVGNQYGPDSPLKMQIEHNLGSVYTRLGNFTEAQKAYEIALKNPFDTVDSSAGTHAMFAVSLAQGSSPARAVEEALLSARMSREMFVLQARTLPERQALAYDATRPHSLDSSVSVLLKHPTLPAGDIYQEVVRSRALVADEMARRQKNLNADNDPETGRLLEELNHARVDLLAIEHSSTHSSSDQSRLQDATGRMESIERTLAEHSVVLRADQRIQQATTEDIRRNLPAGSVLISYFKYRRCAVDGVDPGEVRVPSYMAFVVHPDSDRVRFFSMGDAASLDRLISKARGAALAESRSGGLASIRNERMYREAALAIRQRVWDPLKDEIGDVRLALVVGDGNLNLIPFAGLPNGSGYLVEHGPVIHMLSSERDLVTPVQSSPKTGLLAIGSPSFTLAESKPPELPVRGASPPCSEFNKLAFGPLPGTAIEVSDIDSAWRRWNANEPSHLIVGDKATLAAFLSGATQNRVLHVATHAFLLDSDCGGNPLLHSGLVFTGGSRGATQSILTAQQIASLQLAGVDWAVLSACNTGNGELHDGEGVLGLQRAFRVAGARSVIMTLWPVDDDSARQFMHYLYAARLGDHATTADAVWNSSKKLLLQRRKAGKSTHPWYWAGFIGSGGWE